MTILPAALLAALALAGEPAAARKAKLSPIPKAQAVSTHGPFESGDCDTCHERNDPTNPGKPVKASNALCYACHEEFQGKAPLKFDRKLHPGGERDCMTCHSPHNSAKKKLML